MKGIKLFSLIAICSSFSSLITWLYIQNSYEAGYDLIGLTCRSSTVSLNTKMLGLEDNNELRCHLAKHTRWMADDLEAAEVTDKHIIGGPNLPTVTKLLIRETIEEYRSTKFEEYASQCETNEKLL